MTTEARTTTVAMDTAATQVPVAMENKCVIRGGRLLRRRASQVRNEQGRKNDNGSNDNWKLPVAMENKCVIRLGCRLRRQAITNQKRNKEDCSYHKSETKQA